jgi:glutaredoxin
MTKIEIYYASSCGLCTKAIDFFREQGLSFSVFAVEWDEAADDFVESDSARAMQARCGEKVDFVPQIFIGDRHIKGWRSLKPLIESGEFDELLA